VRKQDGEISRGVIFAHPDRLEKLWRHGYLTLMDATHQTNWLGWFLYAMMVRTPWGQWIPCAHFLCAQLDGDIIAEGLKTLKTW
jgi:hypothetical protein